MLTAEIHDLLAGSWPPLEWGTLPCATSDPESFFPSPYEHARYVRKRVCGPCPHREECLAYALRRDEVGIWGGTTDQERQKIKERGAHEPARA